MKLFLFLALAVTASAADPLIWSRGAANSTEEYLDGKLIRTIQYEGLRVSTHLFFTAKDAVAAEVYVVNDSVKPVNVLPDQMFVSATPPNAGAKPAFLAILPLDVLIAAVRRDTAISAAFTQLAASFQTTTTRTQSVASGNVTLIGPGGITTGTINGTIDSTTTGPNWEARRLAAYQSMQMYAMARDRVTAIQIDALKANMVHSGGAIGWIVWAARHKFLEREGKQLVLDNHLDQTTFQFLGRLR